MKLWTKQKIFKKNLDTKILILLEGNINLSIKVDTSAFAILFETDQPGVLGLSCTYYNEYRGLFSWF